jgi:hypothetical protein
MKIRWIESWLTCLIAFLVSMFLTQGCEGDRQYNPRETQAHIGALVVESGAEYSQLSEGLWSYSDSSCLEYNYVGDSMLCLRHVNAGFNCCPLIDATVAVEGDEITITESESFPEGYGHLYTCLFDLDYEIHNIQPGIYTISVQELYLIESDESLQFTVDLSESKSGVFCVERGHYPWGMLVVDGVSSSS